MNEEDFVTLSLSIAWALLFVLAFRRAMRAPVGVVRVDVKSPQLLQTMRTAKKAPASKQRSPHDGSSLTIH